MQKSSLCALFLISACHAAPPPEVPAESAPRGDVPRAPVLVSRELARSAQFAELVQLLEQEDALGAAQAPCLLGENDRGYLFAGAASVALHPLPPTATELDGVIARAEGIRLLTREGSYGPDDASLGLVALTELPAARDPFLLVLTDRGVYVRELSERDVVATPAEKLVEAITSRGESRALYVVAEAAVPVARLHDVLGSLAQRSGAIGLAMAMPSDVVLPARAPKPTVALCPDGLPATDAVEGDLAMDALLEGVAPLRDQAGQCLARAEGAGRAGGRLVLAMRIDDTGRVIDSCLVTSEVEDAELTRCVLDLSRSLRFDAPSPKGVVDAQLPLSLRSDARPAQRAVCDGKAGT